MIVRVLSNLKDQVPTSVRPGDFNDPYDWMLFPVVELPTEKESQGTLTGFETGKREAGELSGTTVCCERRGGKVCGFLCSRPALSRPDGPRCSRSGIGAASTGVAALETIAEQRARAGGGCSAAWLDPG